MFLAHARAADGYPLSSEAVIIEERFRFKRDGFPHLQLTVIPSLSRICRVAIGLNVRAR